MSRTTKFTHTDDIPGIPIVSTLTLPVCWICRKRFIDSDGDDPSVIREEHHPVPQAYGGATGPTVSLCTGDHSLLHLIAEGMIAKQNPQYLRSDVLGQLGRLPRPQLARIVYLSKVVYNAWYATKDDPNKKTPVSVELSGAQRRKLEQLCKFRGLNRQKLLAELIEEAFAKNFPS